MARHSPAPFYTVEASHLGDPAHAVCAADGDFIAVGMLKVDADLFAAAPDLLKALKALVGAVFAPNADGSPSLTLAAELSVAAIAKADSTPPREGSDYQMEVAS